MAALDCQTVSLHSLLAYRRGASDHEAASAANCICVDLYPVKLPNVCSRNRLNGAGVDMETCTARIVMALKEM